MSGDLLSFGLLLGFWLLLANSRSLPEVVAGIVVAALGVVAFHFATGDSSSLRIPCVSASSCLRFIGKLFMEPIGLSFYLLRDLRGEVPPARVTKFVMPTARERFTDRALAVFLTSLSSKSFVIDLPAETGEMLIHELEPQPLPEVVKELAR